MYEYFAAWCPCVTVLRDYSPETLSSTCHLISEPTLHPQKEDINNGEGRRTGKAEAKGTNELPPVCPPLHSSEAPYFLV